MDFLGVILHCAKVHKFFWSTKVHESPFLCMLFFYRPNDLSLLKLFSKFLILSMIVIFPLSRLSRVIPVVLDVVSIALKLYNVNDFKHPTVCIAQLDFLTLMCVFNCAAGKSSWQSWRFYLLCPWQKEYNWQSAWGDDLLKLHSENFRKLSTASIKSVSLY